jgi:hypothetical protein
VFLGRTYLFGRIVAVVLFAPQLGVHLQLDIFEVNLSVDIFHVTLGHVVLGALEVVAVGEL